MAAPATANAAACVCSAVEFSGFAASNPFGTFQTFKFTANLNSAEANAGPK